MERRMIRRALAGAMTVLILTAVAANADTVPADGDAVTIGNQSLIVLPDASPGQVVTWPVTFQLTCAGFGHAAPGATIQLDFGGATVPLDGHVSVTSTTIGPVPADWTADGEGCPFPSPTLAAAAPSTVTLTMPSTPGTGDRFTIFWAASGAAGITGLNGMTFQVNVLGNTPPTIHLPADITAEATSPAGAAVTWSATATDAEDASPPTPTCAPASGSTFPLGLTTVACSVVDGGGLHDSGSIHVSVVDTTAPALVGMPADLALTSADPTGTTLIYSSPTATDLADSSPTVRCLPASGSHVVIGTTTVTCAARDASGNHASGTFSVAVAFVPAVTWSAIWGEPVATVGSTFVANSGRTVPVKVELFANGVEQTRGSGLLTLTTCAGRAVGTVALSWEGGRWAARLDTGMLGGPGCYLATVSLDGSVAGSFRVDLRGPDPASVANGQKGKTQP